jgi:hypothetical protein
MTTPTIHDKECACERCLKWYTLRMSGRCGCTAPWDEHRLDAHGIALQCPKRGR